MSLTRCRGSERKRAVLQIVLTVLACAQVSCQQRSADRQPLIEIRLASNAPFDGSSRVDEGPAGQVIYVAKSPMITSEHFAEASLATLERGRLGVLLRLRPEGEQVLKSNADRYIGKPLAVFLKGELIQTPVVLSSLGSQLIITRDSSGLSEREADEIVAAISG